jgi:proliferating cell nuclear antigen
MPETQPETDGFEAQIDTAAFEEYLQALDALVNEALIEPHDGGFRTDGIDPANVAMARTTLAVDAFGTAPTAGDPFGITVEKVRDVIPETDATTLQYDGDKRKLTLKGGPYRYTHSALNADTVRESDGPPEMDLNFEARLDGDLLREAVEWFFEFTTHIRVGFDPDNATFWMEADERQGNSIGTDDGVFELPRDEMAAVRQFGHADSMFSADYFRDIVRAIPEGREVTIRVGEESPMLLAYPIHDSAGEPCGRVEFMQAPRIQSE